MKLICLDCGKQYDSGKFCPECGTKLQEIVPELVCPSCGTKAKSGKFCPECGTKLVEQVAESVSVSTTNVEEVIVRKFNEKDPRLAKYYDKKGFPRTIPQEEYAVAKEELYSFVAEGSAEAKMLLGVILLNNSNEDEIYKGIELLKEAEQSGDKFAYYFMGYGYYIGAEPLVSQNHDEAEKRLLEYYEEYDNGDSAQLLADLYTFSDEKCNYIKAFKYATIAAEDDECEGYKILGTLYLNGWGVEKNIELALENYKCAAALGDEDAMNQIGVIFLEGGGFEADPKQAYYWFNEAAIKGSIVAMYNLGYCYQNGVGVDEDAEIAAEWYKKSAEGGYIDAMYELGEYYQTTLLDINKSKKWYLEAAEQGHSEAQNKLGVLYSDDLEPDYKEAIKWYKKAMEQDNAWAYRNYAMCLWNGNGVKENKNNAIKMMKKAISLGLTSAEEELKELQNPSSCADYSTTSSNQNTVTANEWFVPEGTKILNNSTLPSTDKQWRESVEIIHLPDSLQDIDIFLEDADPDESCDLFIFTNLKKLIIPYGCMEKFCKIGYWIDSSWDKVWYEDGSHVCPEIIPIIEGETNYFITNYSDEVVNGCPNGVSTLLISPNCKEIGKKAFRFNKSLENVFMSDNVKLIGKEAFSGCENLKNIRLSKNVKTLQKEVLGHCNKIKEIIIPEGVEAIEEAAFVACKSLESISLPSTICKIDKGGTWGFNPFQLCDSLRKIIVPKGKKAHFQQLLKGFSGNPARYIEEA